MSEPVRFSKPPVTELVFDVSFRLTPPLQTPHVGAYWNTIRDEFPHVSDKPPLSPVQLPVAGGGQAVFDLDLSGMPPVRRTWFEDEPRVELIQIQEDRFIYNWRRSLDRDSYPGFDVVRPLFEQRLSRFQNFLASAGLGTMEYVTFELTYVNQIGPGNGLADYAVDTALVDHMRDESRQRFLPRPNVATTIGLYWLPESDGVLRIQSQGVPGNLRLDLAVNVDATGRDEAGRRRWYDVAHNWIIRGFKDATRPEFHSVHWGAE